MKKLIWIFVAAFCFRLILSFPVWHGDMENHMDWGIRFWEYGPSKFFSPETNVWSDTWPNQPPGTIYTFALTRKFFEGVFSVFWWINVNVPFFPSGVVSYFETNLYPALLKLPSILADLGIGYLIYKLTKRKIGLVLWLFNPVIWYNSAVWGQTDALVNFFALLSFYLLLQRKLTYSLLAVSFSLFIKASLLIFVPIWAVVALRQKYKFSRYLASIFCSLIVIALLTLPFSQGNPLVWLYELYIKKVFAVQLHLLTANAFNLWAILTGIHQRPDIYQYWGYFLFLVVYIPLLFKIYKKQDLKSVAWVLALSAFSSFMLLTNMHERYLYPLFPYLTILVALDFRLFVIYVAVSFIHLLNLYNFWWYPEIGFIKNFLSFGNRLMPRILAVINMILYILTYKFFLRQMRQSRL